MTMLTCSSEKILIQCAILVFTDTQNFSMLKKYDPMSKCPLKESEIIIGDPTSKCPLKESQIIIGDPTSKCTLKESEIIIGDPTSKNLLKESRA